MIRRPPVTWRRHSQTCCTRPKHTTASQRAPTPCPARAADQAAYTVEITVAATPAARRGQQPTHSYCLDCDWTVSTAAYPREEVTDRMVRHAVETGHDIESTNPLDALDDGTDRSPSV